MNNLQESLYDAKMLYVMMIDKGQHILYDTKTEQYEIWVTNKNFAGYSLKWRNTDLEFCSTIPYGKTITTRYGTFVCQANGYTTTTSLAKESDILDVIAKMNIPYSIHGKGINLRKIIDNCLACGIINKPDAI
jgi:hypothetical protein